MVIRHASGLKCVEGGMWQVTYVRLIQGDHWPVLTVSGLIHTTQTNPVIEGVRPSEIPGWRVGKRHSGQQKEWAWGRVYEKLCRYR